MSYEYRGKNRIRLDINKISHKIELIKMLNTSLKWYNEELRINPHISKIKQIEISKALSRFILEKQLLNSNHTDPLLSGISLEREIINEKSKYIKWIEEELKINLNIRNSDQLRLYKAKTNLIHKSHWNLVIGKNKIVSEFIDEYFKLYDKSIEKEDLGWDT